MQSEHDRLVTRCVGCSACRLRLSRRNAVVYRGSCPSPLMLIGEAPGAGEDDQGMPFVGPTGQLLTWLLLQAEIPPEVPYLTNAVKCRPPQNKEPAPCEVATCRPFLQDQVALVNPRRIVTLGHVATWAVTAAQGTMGVLLGLGGLGCFWAPKIPVIPVHHPAYLLANGVEVRDTVARLKRAWLEAQK